jgi:hypothetical protein
MIDSFVDLSVTIPFMVFCAEIDDIDNKSNALNNDFMDI